MQKQEEAGRLQNVHMFTFYTEYIHLKWSAAKLLREVGNIYMEI